MRRRVKETAGFTLVELIVVIAILGILAGVAVPAYSGYVKKAERAADEALLSSVNMAFATACLQDGFSQYELNPSGVRATLDANGNLTEVTVGEISDFNTKFQAFYAGGTNAFKGVTGLVYQKAGGGFVFGHHIVTEGGLSYKATEADVEAYKATTWYSEMSSEEILNLAAGVADGVQEGYTTAFQNMIGDPAYQKAAAAALGLTDSEYATFLTEKQAELTEKYKTDGGMTNKQAKQAAERELNSNIAILVATKDAQVEGSKIIDILKAGNAKDAISATLDGNSTKGLAQATLAYGLYNSWIYSRKDLTAEQKKEQATPSNALGGFNDSAFQAHLDSAQAQADLKGMLAALNVLNTQDKNTVGSLVTGGLNNQSVIDAISGVLGN